MLPSRRQLRRFLAPTSAVGGAVFSTILGLVLLVSGLSISFSKSFAPIVVNLSLFWNKTLGPIIGNENIDTTNHVMGGALLSLGMVLLWVGVRGVFRSFVRTLNPNVGPGMATTFIRRQQLARGPSVVALGGGTGLSTLLRGLKRHTSNITAIVTVTDDGGSSGRLSEELGIIPPGDIRNCLVALADSEKQLTDIFQYRFTGTSGSLSGHNLGNLLIAGFIDICDGDFERALNMASEVLAIRGRVIPSTLQNVRLKGILDTAEEIYGETKIVAAGGRIRRMMIEPNDCHPFPEAIQTIIDAELIVIGPGSVFTSVIPNLLVPGIAEAINKSKATKVYVCNVMTQPGESDAFTAAEHVLAIEANTELRVFDYVLLNTQLPSYQSQTKYREKDQFVVEPDLDRIRSMGFRTIVGDFMSESDFVRHDPGRVAESLMQVLNK